MKEEQYPDLDDSIPDSGVVCQRARFKGIAAAGTAEILFFVFFVVFTISLIAKTVRGKKPPV